MMDTDLTGEDVIEDDTKTYISDLSGELAAMAEVCGLNDLAGLFRIAASEAGRP